MCRDIFINCSILASVITLFVAMLVLESRIYNLGGPFLALYAKLFIVGRV